MRLKEGALRLGIALVALGMAGCMGGKLTNSSETTGGPARGDGAFGSPGTPTTPSPSPTPSPEPTQPGSGVLTAGAWDDNRNFDFFTKYQADRETLQGRLPLTLEEQTAAHDAHASLPGARARLDVALVIDTTGSMGDEIGYLQTELGNIVGQIESRFPSADQRWSIVLYRDDGDDYVVRSFDFDPDLNVTKSRLGQAVAGGGGDYPEAPDLALAQAVQLGWRADADVARLVFWIADAPHHLGHEQAFAQTLREYAGADIHVYPVASSGVDDLTELTMRQAAQLTGGRYLFLTNDSGVGDDHKEPVIPCYFVTHLDRAMVRMVSIELSGVYAEPDAADVLRRAGDPTDGRCQLTDDRVAYVF